MRHTDLTRAQRDALLAADPATGLLTGSERVRQALAERGLALRHPRPPHRHYLTAAGREARATLLAPPPEPAEAPGPRPGAPRPGVFAARTGDEEAPAGRAADRAADVGSAWEGLCELRRMTAGDPALPCPWERAHLVAAAALALEAAGCPPSARDPEGRRTATGYRVLATAQLDAVAVTWAPADDDGGPPGHTARAAALLRECTAALERAGWQVTAHAARPPGPGYLLASPRRR